MIARAEPRSAESAIQSRGSPGPADLMTGENRQFDLIRRIRSRAGRPEPPLIVGPGDDAAVLEPPPGMDLVFTVDTLTEGIHFRREWFSASDLGWKAVVQSLSDLAAMGSRPMAFCAALSMPGGTPSEWVDSFMDGLMGASRRWKCALAGGNLGRSAGECVSVTVAMLGTVGKGRGLLRSGAKAGDAVYLTGWPGLAPAGLADLQRDPFSTGPHVDRFKRPGPCLEEAEFLAANMDVHAAIDTSDGVWRSLALLSEESGVSILARAADLPLHEALLSAAGRCGADPLEWAVFGGEDFELAVSAGPSASAAEAEKDFLRRFGRPLTRVGYCSGGSGLRIEGAPEGRDFQHF